MRGRDVQPEALSGVDARKRERVLHRATTGNCGAGTQPVWRFYHARTINHRYTTDHTTRDAMRADPGTWTPEGYGPDSVIMCAPVGT